MRQLQPLDLQIEIEHLTCDEAMKVAWFSLPWYVSLARARSMRPQRNTGRSSCDGIESSSWMLLMVMVKRHQVDDRA
jgi:hypothetical protein